MKKVKYQCAVHLPATLTTKQEVPQKVVWLDRQKAQECDECLREAIAYLEKKAA